MHEFVSVRHCGSESLRNRLVPEAYAEEWNTCIECGHDKGNRYPGIFRLARTGGDQYTVIGCDALSRLRSVEGVISQNVGLGPELHQVAVERVDETVVVIDDKNTGHRPAPTVTSWLLTIASTHGNTQVESTYSAAPRRISTSRMRSQIGPGRIFQSAAYT